MQNMFSAHDDCHFSKSALDAEQKLWSSADVGLELSTLRKAKGGLKLGERTKPSSTEEPSAHQVRGHGTQVLPCCN